MTRKPIPAPRPRGAVFVSYRQRDGSPAAHRVAWALRAVGLPVWHDKTDLPPGDTIRVISQALDSGLSGAVLVVTDDIAHSPVVKKVEWPKIRELNQDGAFTLGILNGVLSDQDVYAAPDRLLRRLSDRLMLRYTHHLSGLKQYRLAGEEDQTDQLAADLLRQRLHHLMESITARGYVHIDLATRADPKAEYAENADLTFRWDRGEGRDSGQTAQQALQRTFHLAASSIRQHTSGPIRFHGQAHLSFGAAIGASLTLGPIIEFANEDGLWTVSRDGGGDTARLTDVAINRRASAGPVIIFVDLLQPESVAAYDTLAANGHWSESVRIRLAHRTGRIHSADGDQLVHEVAAEIRAASARNKNAQVHLLLYAPLPVALLLGTLLNTLDVIVYEWQRPNDGQTATYVPKFRLRPGEHNPISLVD